MPSTEFIVITVNTPEIRNALQHYARIEIVGSQGNFICWRWVSPPDKEFSSIQTLSGYKGIIQIV